MDVNILEEKANQGDIDALIQVADMYFDGEGVKLDYNKAALYFYKLAEAEHPYGYYSIGYCYQRGLGVDMNEEEALYWFKKGSDEDSVQCRVELAKCYMFGIGTSINNDEAYDLFDSVPFRKSLDAVYYKSFLVLYSKTRKGTPEIALESLIELASVDHLSAIRLLGRLYYEGNNEFVKKDEEKGIFYYEKGAELGEDTCLFYLGLLHLEGRLSNSDFQKGIELIEKSAKLGNPDANLVLGDMYANYNIKNSKEYFVEKDIEKALDYYKKSFEEENEIACQRLASYYLIVGNYDKFVDYIIKGTELENGWCAYNYFLTQYFGMYGVKKDYVASLDTLNVAIDDNFKPAVKLISKFNKNGFKSLKYNKREKYFKKIKKQANKNFKIKIDKF